MRKTVMALTMLASFTFLASCASLSEKPFEKNGSENTELAKKLAINLNGSEWIYTWRGRDFNFQFNENGTIGILESWNDVQWFASGENDVVLEGGNSKMLLSFNSDASAFNTIDWDGEPSAGKRLIK